MVSFFIASVRLHRIGLPRALSSVETEPLQQPVVVVARGRDLAPVEIAVVLDDLLNRASEAHVGLGEGSLVLITSLPGQFQCLERLREYRMGCRGNCHVNILQKREGRATTSEGDCPSGGVNCGYSADWSALHS